MTLNSDKFTFPQGDSRSLTLDRPTTPVRIQARSRTSGDRLPVDVTLTTPDGQLVIARTVLTVHATSISLVGIALTALAPSCCWCGGSGRGAGAPSAVRGPPDMTRWPPSVSPRRGSGSAPRRRPTSPSAPGSRVSPGCCASSPWPGPWDRATWPTPSTWPTPRPTCSTTSCWAGCSRPRSSPSSSTTSPTGPRTTAFRSISAVISASVAVLVATTALAWVLAPYIITAPDRARHVGARQPDRPGGGRALRGHRPPALVRDPDRRVRASSRWRRRSSTRAVASWPWPGPPSSTTWCASPSSIWFGAWTHNSASLASVEQHHEPAAPPRSRNLARRGTPGRRCSSPASERRRPRATSDGAGTPTTPRCARSSASAGGPSASWWPTRSRCSWSSSWPAPRPGPTRSRRTPTPTPSCRCPTPSSPSPSCR